MRLLSLLGDVCGPSWTYMHWDSFVPYIGYTVPQVEAHLITIQAHFTTLFLSGTDSF